MTVKPEPWLAPGAKEWLEGRIQPDWFAFEWGTGGSTLWLERLCASLYSVEHDEAWFWKVAAQIKPSTMLQRCPPGAGALGDDEGDPSQYRAHGRTGMNFSDYARTIDALGPFDLVMIDGRARASCIVHAVPKVRRGGILVLDNVEREWYLRETAHLLEGWERVDFSDGKGWTTSAWTRP